MDYSAVPGIPAPQARDYKCPCGKTYLSYAALFTHIKQKHQGKAPGPIEKPKTESKPRGRPPLSSKVKASPVEKDGDASRDTDNTFKEPGEKDANKVYWEAYEQIFSYLRQILRPEEIDLKIWAEVDSFKKFQEFIDNNSEQKNFKYQGATLGFGLSEFLKTISLKTEPWRFEQVLILFMLLLQYVMDETNTPKIIQQASAEILIEFMNPFMNYHIDDFSQYLQIDGLWIMNKVNMHNVFMCFYNWLKWKNYTSFCITLID